MNAKRTAAESGGHAPADDEPISPLRISLSENLLNSRGESKLSQRELAEKAGVNQRLIWEIERKARNVTLETVSILARALGMDELDLLARRKKRR